MNIKEIVKKEMTIKFGKKEKKTSGSAAETAKPAKKSKSIKIGCYEHKRSRLEKDGRRIKD